jgi:hypothetical protein
MAAIIDDVRMRLEANGPECRIDEVLDLCPDLTWNQVFLAIDYLNRTSQVQLKIDRACRYWVKVGSSSIAVSTGTCLPRATSTRGAPSTGRNKK